MPNTLSSFRISSLLGSSVPLFLRSSAFQHSCSKHGEILKRRGREKQRKTLREKAHAIGRNLGCLALAPCGLVRNYSFISVVSLGSSGCSSAGWAGRRFSGLDVVQREMAVIDFQAINAEAGRIQSPTGSTKQIVPGTPTTCVHTLLFLQRGQYDFHTVVPLRPCLPPT